MPATATKERPALFSAPMVRALLEDRKTKTRRMIKAPLDYMHKPDGPRHAKHYYRRKDGCWDSYENMAELTAKHCPYGKPGDRLWVKETFMMFERAETMVSNAGGPFRPNGEYIPGGVGYRADLDECGQVPVTDGKITVWRTPKGPWRPSLFMPRALSRITLEITDVKVERVEEISEADALAEGVRVRREKNELLEMDEYTASGIWHPTARAAFLELFYDINERAPRGSNPWVWALTFKVVK